VIRNDKHIRSYLDAQGFRKEGRKLFVAPVDAVVFHYGWVKPPEAQQAKQQTFHRYWHTDRWIEKSVPKADAFDYTGMDFLSPYTGSHPQVMNERIARQNWQFSPDQSKKGHSVKARILHFIERETGWRVGEYRNYRIVR
jgi:hypothetical protein